jgi:prephenate dehydrogenase
VDRLADYVTLAVAIHGVAVVIVNLTPTPKDNERLTDVARVVVKAYRAIEIVAGIVSKRAKQ